MFFKLLFSLLKTKKMVNIYFNSVHICNTIAVNIFPPLFFTKDPPSNRSFEHYTFIAPKLVFT